MAVFMGWTIVTYSDAILNLQTRLDRMEKTHVDYVQGYESRLDEMVTRRVDYLLKKVRMLLGLILFV